MTEEQRKQFEDVVTPVIAWLCENMHPHAKVIIDCTTVELVEGTLGFQNVSFLKD